MPILNVITHEHTHTHILMCTNTTVIAMYSDNVISALRKLTNSKQCPSSMLFYTNSQLVIKLMTLSYVACCGCRSTDHWSLTNAYAPSYSTQLPLPPMTYSWNICFRSTPNNAHAPTRLFYTITL